MAVAIDERGEKERQFIIGRQRKAVVASAMEFGRVKFDSSMFKLGRRRYKMSNRHKRIRRLDLAGADRCVAGAKSHSLQIP